MRNGHVPFLSCAPRSAHRRRAARHGVRHTAPAGTSFYVTTENLGEWPRPSRPATFTGACMRSRRSRRPSNRASPRSQGEVGFARGGEQWPQLVRAAASLLNREVVFASTGRRLAGIVRGIIQFARVALLAQEYKMGGMDRQVGDHLGRSPKASPHGLGLSPFALAVPNRPACDARTDGRRASDSASACHRANGERRGDRWRAVFTTLTVVPALFSRRRICARASCRSSATASRWIQSSPHIVRSPSRCGSRGWTSTWWSWPKTRQAPLRRSWLAGRRGHP